MASFYYMTTSMLTCIQVPNSSFESILILKNVEIVLSRLNKYRPSYTHFHSNLSNISIASLSDIGLLCSFQDLHPYSLYAKHFHQHHDRHIYIRSRIIILVFFLVLGVKTNIICNFPAATPAMWNLFPGNVSV